jgi:hypothetical protein
MENVSGLTMNQALSVSKEAEKDGYKDTISFENVPAGSVICSLVIGKVKENGKSINSPLFSVIKFEREKDGETLKLKFIAVKLNALHVSTGKSYNNIDAKVTTDLQNVLQQSANWGKSLNFESAPYKDSSGRDRTILKFESIDK